MKHLPERVQRKLKALRAMANDASSENEALIAARQLYILMAKYDVQEIEIEENGLDIGTEAVEVDHTKTGLWAGVIARGLAELYFCHIYQSTNRQTGKNLKRYFHVTGNNNHRFIATMMIRKVVALVDLKARTTCKLRPSNDDPWAYICSFRTEAATRIQSRCYQMMNEGKQGKLDDGEGGTLPALLNAYARHEADARAYIEAAGVQLGAGNQKAAAASSAGRSAGRDFGDKVGLRQELGGMVKSRLLGRG
jgi:hypothetical protein